MPPQHSGENELRPCFHQGEEKEYIVCDRCIRRWNTEFATLQGRVKELEQRIVEHHEIGALLESAKTWTCSVCEPIDPRSVSEAQQRVIEAHGETFKKLSDTSVSQPNPSDTFGGESIAKSTTHAEVLKDMGIQHNCRCAQCMKDKKTEPSSQTGKREG